MSPAGRVDEHLSKTPKPALCLAEGDHVANVLEFVANGDSVDIRSSGSAKTTTGTAGGTAAAVVSAVGGALIATQNISKFHKIALLDLDVGEQIVRDGYVIGIASCPIKRGDWVHIHNLKSQRA